MTPPDAPSGTARFSAGIVAVFAFLLAILTIVQTHRAIVNGDAWLANPEHRLPNIRLVDADCRAAFIRRFISRQDWSKRPIVFIGDSQMMGNGFKIEETWTHLLSQKLTPPAPIVVLGVMDGRPRDTAFVAGQLPLGAARLAVANINQTGHLVETWLHVPPIAPRPFEFETCAFEARRMLLGSALRLPSDLARRETYRFSELEADRYDKPIRREEVLGLLKAVAATSDRTVAFLAPNNVATFARHGYDIEKFRRNNADMLASCRQSGVVCADLSEAMPGEHYTDMVHWTLRGNVILADTVCALIPPGPLLSKRCAGATDNP